MEFKDYFSKQSGIYAQARPGYPDELFHFLVSLVREKKLAWDCGTGNGQAAVSLAKYFNRVIATDASEAQIKNAFRNEKVEYRITPSEKSGLQDSSLDLVTAAAAVHWFNLDKFYAEVKRVLKPGGIIAVWSYSGTRVNEEVDKVVYDLALNILKDYWPQESQLVWGKYKDLPFPFEPVPPPPVVYEMEWNLFQLVNYLTTWSSTQNYILANGKNPVEEIFSRLKQAWGDEREKKKVSWELAVKVGRKSLAS